MRGRAALADLSREKGAEAMKAAPDSRQSRVFCRVNYRDFRGEPEAGNVLMLEERGNNHSMPE